MFGRARQGSVVGLRWAPRTGYRESGPCKSLHDAEVRAFEELARDLPSFGIHHQQVLRFVAILADWIRGHLDWAVETGRYVAPVPHVSESGEFERADYRLLLDEHRLAPQAEAAGM